MKAIKYNTAIPKEDIYSVKCPILYSLLVIGSKWKLPIIWHLSHKKVIRYNELKRNLTGITNIMLTKCLRELEEHYIVKRVQYDTKVPKVEYLLAERGMELLPTLNELYTWGLEQYEIEKQNNIRSTKQNKSGIY